MSLQVGPHDTQCRCAWCGTDSDYVAYHDNEWGRVVHDDRKFFEMLTLEGAQAGLSWLTILRRRAAYRRAYADWQVEKVARFGLREREHLLSAESGIIRNRLKVRASITNAQKFIALAEEFGSFDAYVWRFTDGRPRIPSPPPATMRDVPTETDASRALSKDLFARGFRFVGPVILYSFMQACGLVNDHLAGCFLCPSQVRKP